MSSGAVTASSCHPLRKQSPHLQSNLSGRIVCWDFQSYIKTPFPCPDLLEWIVIWSRSPSIIFIWQELFQESCSSAQSTTSVFEKERKLEPRTQASEGGLFKTIYASDLNRGFTSPACNHAKLHFLTLISALFAVRGLDRKTLYRLGQRLSVHRVHTNCGLFGAAAISPVPLLRRNGLSRFVPVCFVFSI